MKKIIKVKMYATIDHNLELVSGITRTIRNTGGYAFDEFFTNGLVWSYDKDAYENDEQYRKDVVTREAEIRKAYADCGVKVSVYKSEYWNGYEIYFKDCNGKPYDVPYLYCKDNPDAVEVIRALLGQGLTICVHNQYQTFYGCGWGDWLERNTKDLATAEVLSTWDAWGDCAPYPSEVKLTPITK